MLSLYRTRVLSQAAQQVRSLSGLRSPEELRKKTSLMQLLDRSADIFFMTEIFRCDQHNV